jgi:hypothetical protein
VSLRSFIVSFGASLGAILVALEAWKAADAIIDALGLGPLRPLILVAVLFLSLTVLQALWDRVERIIPPCPTSDMSKQGAKHDEPI